MRPLPAKIHAASLCLVLLACFDWSLWNAIQLRAPPYIFDTVMVGLAAGGAIFDRRWTKYVVFLVGIFIVGEWFLSVLLALRIGYYSHLKWPQVVISLLPGLAVALLVAYASHVAGKYVGRPEPSESQ